MFQIQKSVDFVPQKNSNVSFLLISFFLRTIMKVTKNQLIRFSRSNGQVDTLPNIFTNYVRGWKWLVMDCNTHILRYTSLRMNPEILAFRPVRNSIVSCPPWCPKTKFVFYFHWTTITNRFAWAFFTFRLTNKSISVNRTYFKTFQSLFKLDLN